MNQAIKKQRLFPLDFVRVISASLIVLFHFNTVLVFSPDIHTQHLLFLNHANGTIGQIGVSLFFILSGASLMYTYETSLKPAAYYKKRFLSIFPLFWLTYGVFFIHFYLRVGVSIPAIPRRYLLLSVLGMDGYLNELIPTFYLVGEWFLGCILLIYLVFPLLRAAVLKFPRLTACMAAAIYVPLVLYYPFRMSAEHFFLMRVPEVLFGIYFIHYLYGTEEARKRFDFRFGAVSGLVFAFALFVHLDIPPLFQTLITCIPGFLFFIWAGQFIQNRKIRQCISVYSNYTFALFLVHHILVPQFIVPLTGRDIGRIQLYAVFIRYFLYIHFVAFVLYHVSRILVRLASAAFAAASGR